MSYMAVKIKVLPFLPCPSHFSTLSGSNATCEKPIGAFEVFIGVQTKQGCARVSRERREKGKKSRQ